MSIPRWTPRAEITKQEERRLKSLAKTRKLLAFLRLHRTRLFDEAFQTELASMYRDTGEGMEPVAPALLAMTLLLQSYEGLGDARAIERTWSDKGWQMVLGLDGDEAAFGQGTLSAFRERLIAHDMDRRMLERTVELAKETGAFDWKKLPKTLRLAVDSRPLTGAGRVEDTFNLIAHAARKLLASAAALAGHEAARMAKKTGAPLLASGSIKARLDIEWSDGAQKAAALGKLLEQVESLEAWVREHLPEQAERPPLSEHLATLRQLREQDLEPDPSDPSGQKKRIRNGVAEGRRISIEEPEMRHGRKSKSRTINGYKSHLGVDLDTELVLACAVTPANRPEAEALGPIAADVGRYSERTQVAELHIDRGYLAAEQTHQLAANDTEIVCKPWSPPPGPLFSKKDFLIDLRKKQITCPAGNTESLELGTIIRFDAATCAACPLRAQCTAAAPGRGRTVSIAADEPLQQELRSKASTPAGRRRLRKRVTIEHRLAHLSRKQGPRARYRGVRKNLMDLRRHSSVLNLERIHLANAA
ncbi:MAG: IS1182 family transposase [Polyangiaceae bacterium]